MQIWLNQIHKFNILLSVQYILRFLPFQDEPIQSVYIVNSLPATQTPEILQNKPKLLSAKGS